MNIESLRDYLLVFSKEGYAKDPGTENPDGSMTIRHKQGPWETNDTYRGGEPYGGAEAVSYEGKPIWTMLYYGSVKPEIEDINKVYNFLREALVRTNETFPLRGPETYKKDNLIYKNHWHGGLEKFNGKEHILEDGKEIYFAEYMGGLINQR